MNELDIFSAALEIPDPDARAAFLSAVCKQDSQLKSRIEELLDIATNDDDFMERAPKIYSEIAEGITQDFSLHDQLAATEDAVQERPGETIGPYKLLQQIGEGGMGVVFMAEQTTPVKRRVALKIVKPGMDSKAVLARFEAERQALTLMDHPNIARALDAGTTETGRPYFVMELVKGTPITKYCDEHKLSLRQRLELFVPVCHAVQHAHQKGIVHRDLKPSNILVAEYDEQAVPKVIDFGVAKALHQPLTEKTLFTQMGQVIGTLEYMSPEQAQVNELDVDTRSDIYSLGVLLYELLTGSTPHDKERLRLAAWEELLRIIRHEDPPIPSKRISTSGTLPTIADSRRTTPGKIGTLIRGDLDWIVMKSLDKDRNRRYATCSGLAEDIHRYLSDEPVLARSPSQAYRFRKFIQRNRGLSIGTAAVAASLLLGIGTTTWQMLRAIEGERSAQEAATIANRNAGNWQRSSQRISEILERNQNSQRETALLLMLVESYVAQQSGSPNKETSEYDELLNSIQAYYDTLIANSLDERGYPTAHSHVYRRQRAISLARFGDHETAFAEVIALAQPETLTSEEWLFDLARACALCAQEAKDKPELAHGYALQGINFINKLVEIDRQERAAEERKQELGIVANTMTTAAAGFLVAVRSEPDFEFLRSRPEFGDVADSDSDQEKN